MNWLSKILRSAPPLQKSGSEFSSAVDYQKISLAKQFSIQVDKAKAHSRLVPPEFARSCHSLFSQQLNDIAEKVVTSELRGVLENHHYKDRDSGIYMIVSVLPWTNEEAVQMLLAESTERPLGYVAMLGNLVKNWPPDMTYLLHVLLCGDGNKFYMHTAMCDYGGKRDFIAYPIELLNEDERKMTGL